MVLSGACKVFVFAFKAGKIFVTYAFKAEIRHFEYLLLVFNLQVLNTVDHSCSSPGEMMLQIETVETLLEIIVTVIAGTIWTRKREKTSKQNRWLCFNILLIAIRSDSEIMLVLAEKTAATMRTDPGTDIATTN